MLDFTTITTICVYPDVPGRSTDLFQELHNSNLLVIVVGFYF